MRLRNLINLPVSPRRTRSAIAAVEMALIAPILAGLMLGMFELSRAVMVRQTLTAAARKGCRTGIVQGFSNNDIINDATDVMRDNGFDSTLFDPSNSIGAINITVNGSTKTDTLNAASGSEVSVQVVIPATSVNWVSYQFLTKTMVESDLVVMMKQ